MSPPPDLRDAFDQEVVAWALQGREEAYGELMRRYQRPVLALIYELVHHREDAKDLTQETFVKAFKALDSYRPELKFSAWIFRIANHLAVDHLRRQQLETVPLEDPRDVTPSGNVRPTGIQLAGQPDSTPTPPPRVRARKLSPALERAIKRLRGNYRRCVVLRYVEERSYDDIAELLGLPVGTVGTYLHRAQAELRAVLGPLRDSSPSDSSCTPA